ncbi:hypothetical protein K474DRAFT_1384977 [Panus rudis PR-1116 ss-1]|nr:hypothetical protein K474DRAFT_1384977 [Panus rudis PR-1116 ss-1]
MRLSSVYLVALASVAAPAALGIPLGTRDVMADVSLIDSDSHVVQRLDDTTKSVGQIAHTTQHYKRVGGSSSSGGNHGSGGSGSGSGSGGSGNGQQSVKLDFAKSGSKNRPNMQQSDLNDVQQYMNDNVHRFRDIDHQVITQGTHNSTSMNGLYHISTSGYSGGVARTGSHVPTGYANDRQGGETWPHDPNQERASKWNTIQQADPRAGGQESRQFVPRPGAEVPKALGYDQRRYGQGVHSNQRDDATYPANDDPHNPDNIRKQQRILAAQARVREAGHQQQPNAYDTYARNNRGGSSNQGGYQDPYGRDTRGGSSGQGGYQDPYGRDTRGGSSGQGGYQDPYARDRRGGSSGQGGYQDPYARDRRGGSSGQGGQDPYARDRRGGSSGQGGGYQGGQSGGSRRYGS